MKKITLILMLASLLLLGGQAFAELCTIDAVPAATLLLPNFKVDIGDADGDGQPDCSQNGLNTLFSINNASAAPALAHVTLWTDWTVPVIDFDVYLTGYDVQTINLCDVIAFGNLPVTADPQSDPNDTISPHQYDVSGGSNNPDWDDDFPACGPFFPFNNPVVRAGALDRAANGLSGYPVAALGVPNRCMGQQLNGAGLCTIPGPGNTGPAVCPAGTIARGYATIDSVSQCSTLFPNEPGYFVDGGMGIANNLNVLFGDYFKIDRANAFAQGEPLVHIEANDDLNATQIPLTNPTDGDGDPDTVATVANATGYTYYGRYTQPDGDDNREPLGTTWGARYLNGGPFDGGTKMTVWRDSTVDQTVEAYVCGLCDGTAVGPSWCPLNELQVVCFNERESVVEICFAGPGGVISPPSPGSDAACFPLETNHLDFGTGNLTVPFNFGWCYLNLNLPAGHPGVPFGGPNSAGVVAQSYVTVTHSALGLYSVGLQAVELSNACQDVNPFIMGDIPEAP